MPKVPDSRLTNYLTHRELKIDNFHPSKELLECSTYFKERPCPHCGEFTNKKYDQRICYVKDIPIKFNTGVSLLMIKKWRFKCIPCNKIFTEIIGGIKKRRRTTERFREMIMWACDRFANLNQVRRDFKVSSDFVYKAFYEQLELKRRMHNNYPWPKLIGIDEHGFGRDKINNKKAFVSMIVNQSRHKLMEVVFGKSRSVLEAQLAHIPGRENVEYVTMDMCDPYRSWVRSFFPQAQIIADKFHVIRLLSPSIMKERRLITSTNADKKAKSLLLCNSRNLGYFQRKAIINFIKKYPKLEQLYHAKEALHVFYKIKGHDRASKSLGHMIERFKASEFPEISKLGRTLSYWKQEILNYFKTGLTNARLEGFNNKASLVRKRAYGYKNPNNYRLRVLSVCS